ncbi:hypothetical protein [Aeromonas phage JELG-KS1]|uniref:Uncharacterized protein n=1 Tax=Aeromonas phage JELG-KS1 TaxID=2951233 RepID=A0A9E7NKP7_9CAUD|nr:hypothetical protein [Aeromonas phage JELG-KS1]
MSTSKRLQHWYWRAETFGKNCLLAIGCLLLIAACLVGSAFGFWLKIRIAEFLFG